jgi:hypothetical protein
MTWTDAVAALRTFVEAQWATTGMAADMPLAFENETADYAGSFLAISIEGIAADKSLYGSVGMRTGVTFGVVFLHAFVPTGTGVATAFAAIDALTTLLELQTVANAIKTEGGAPPSPIAYSERDRDIATNQPSGQFYRCSGSVPFIVISTL